MTAEETLIEEIYKVVTRDEPLIPEIEDFYNNLKEIREMIENFKENRV